MTLIIFFAVLALLIITHEFGHFLFAKLSRVKVEEFGLGFPPRIFGFKKGETLYSLNLIPFGGFVKIFGEEGEENKDKRSFGAQRFHIRALILVAGVLFNLFLAWPFLSATYVIGVPMSVEQSTVAGGIMTEKGVMIIEIQKDTPAETAGLKSADFLLNLSSGNDFLEVSGVKGVQDFIANHIGKEIKIDYSRDGKKFSVQAVPSAKPENGKASLGIAMDEVGIVKSPFYKAVWQGLVSTVRLTGLIAKALGAFFVDIFTKRVMLSQVAGPIGIAGLVGSAWQSGFVFILQLVALLSINLALINFIPFPALDGGRLLFLAVEFVRGKPINQKTANIANNIGFAILIILMLAITYQDISKLIR
ncbi:MAG: site-2 protease family protein [bacterium]|nr:site-2 protease family protein [bacterium]